MGCTWELPDRAPVETVEMDFDFSASAELIVAFPFGK